MNTKQNRVLHIVFKKIPHEKTKTIIDQKQTITNPTINKKAPKIRPQPNKKHYPTPLKTCRKLQQTKLLLARKTKTNHPYKITIHSTIKI